MLFSPVHVEEIEAIPGSFERIELRSILDKMGRLINAKLDETRKRAEELVGLGFGVADAAHIAFAEQGGASFITCDDRLVKKCMTHKISVWCGNPVAYCEREGLK